MICTNCGNNIPDGSPVCPICGAPAQAQYGQQPQYQQQPQFGQQPQYQQQPQFGQQPQYQQQPQFGQQPQYGQQPQFGQQPQANKPASGIDFNGYMQDVKANPIKIATVAGCALVFLSSFLPGWVTAKYGSESNSAGLLASDGGVLKLWALLLVVSCVVAIAMSASDRIGGGLGKIVSQVKALPFSDFYAPALMLILFILCVTNSTFRFVVSAIKVAKAFGASGGYGYAMWFCILGIIAICVEPVMKLVKGEK